MFLFYVLPAHLFCKLSPVWADSLTPTWCIQAGVPSASHAPPPSIRFQPNYPVDDGDILMREPTACCAVDIGSPPGAQHHLTVGLEWWLTVVCSLKENLALHWESMDNEVFLEWTDNARHARSLSFTYNLSNLRRAPSPLRNNRERGFLEWTDNRASPSPLHSILIGWTTSAPYHTLGYPVYPCMLIWSHELSHSLMSRIGNYLTWWGTCVMYMQ